MLFAVGLMVAPTLMGHRMVATFALGLHIISSVGRTIVINGDLPQPVTYGVVDAYRFFSVGTLMIYWMVLRMRHPVNITITSAIFCLLFGTFFLQGTSAIRALVVETGGVAEQATSHDESIIWSITAITGVGLLILCAWFDGYWRSVVPLWGAEYRGVRIPMTPEARREVQRHFRMAWVFFLVFLDIVAIFYICRVLRRPLGLSGDKEWYARLLLGLCAARVVLTMHAVTMILIVVLNPEYRPIGGY